MTKKSYAKVNIFLKIAGKRDGYHELVSRFVRVHSLYDIMSFQNGSFNEFTLEGNFGCETKSNTIYKAYVKLCEISSKVEEFFKTTKVVVEKNIPEFAGLGGGSSNCATFINMVNEVCQLGLSKDELSKIGETIGADVPFFIYEFDSANVTGIGEIVQAFDEKLPEIITFTPKIECNTGKIFTAFRDKFYKEIDQKQADKLLKLTTKELLKNYSKEYLNDLYEPAVFCEPKLNTAHLTLNTKKAFFSGSGSSFFYLNEDSI